jgi:hypothetical protein
VSGWVDTLWLVAAGLLTVGIVFAALVVTEKWRAPIMKDDRDRWRAAPRHGRDRP